MIFGVGGVGVVVDAVTIDGDIFVRVKVESRKFGVQASLAFRRPLTLSTRRRRS